MRIAIVARDYHRRKGIERVAGYYARGLERLGHSVTVVCNQFEATPADSRIVFERVSCTQMLDAVRVYDFAHKSAEWLRKNRSRFDAVLTLGAASVVRGDIVVANSVHRRWFKSSLANLSPLDLRWWLKRFNPLHPAVIVVEEEQYAEGNYKAIIAVSQPTKDELISEYDIPSELVHVLPNGADMAQLAPNEKVRSEKRKQLSLAANEVGLLMVANEFERKGLRPLLKSMSALPPHVKLIVVSGADPAPYLHLVSELKLENRVSFLPATTEIENYYRAADLYVLPTKYEAWNLSITEAQAAGLPVVTTRLGQADTIVADGQSGFVLLNPDDVAELTQAIQKWLQLDDATKRRFSQRAIERASDYSWERQVAKLEAILKATT